MPLVQDHPLKAAGMGWHCLKGLQGAQQAAPPVLQQLDRFVCIQVLQECDAHIAGKAGELVIPQVGPQKALIGGLPCLCQVVNFARRAVAFLGWYFHDPVIFSHLIE